MIVYTAEDFAGAVLATRDTDGVARRMAQESDKPWRASWIPDYDWLSDAQLAAEGWTPVVESRITLDGLAGAWEAAEVPTDDAPMRQGDVYISAVDRNDRGLGYLVAAAGRNGTHMHFNARILSRAQREPWADLEDVLRNEIDLESDPGGIAHALHIKGWRKGGGSDE